LRRHADTKRYDLEGDNPEQQRGQFLEHATSIAPLAADVMDWFLKVYGAGGGGKAGV
jgi:hypothetical protein